MIISIKRILHHTIILILLMIKFMIPHWIIRASITLIILHKIIETLMTIAIHISLQIWSKSILYLRSVIQRIHSILQILIHGKFAEFFLHLFVTRRLKFVKFSWLSSYIYVLLIRIEIIFFRIWSALISIFESFIEKTALLVIS